MKLRVKVDNRHYEVVIGNLHERPIIAVIDGEQFEVWPETQGTPASLTRQHHQQKIPTAQTEQRSPPITGLSDYRSEIHNPVPTGETQTSSTHSIRAPIPGVITEILVQPGAEVETGQELLKLEAMKMNNSIRASRPGKVSAVHITVGQHVKYNDVLLEFSG